MQEAATASSSDNPTEHADHALLAPASGRSASVLALLIWFHHIKSLEKRKRMVEWARELRLAGGCKPGFPGVVVVEGAEDDVREFVARVRSMPWQAMQVGRHILRSLGGHNTSVEMDCSYQHPWQRVLSAHSFLLLAGMHSAEAGSGMCVSAREQHAPLTDRTVLAPGCRCEGRTSCGPALVEMGMAQRHARQPLPCAACMGQVARGSSANTRRRGA